MPVRTKAYLRRADRDDLDVVVEWMEDPDFQRFLYGDPSRSPRQIREQIIGMLGRTGSQQLPQALYLMVDSEDGPIGLLSLQNISWRNRSCSIDLYIGRKELRSSLAAAVAFFRAMMYAFDELNMHRVSAYIYSFNTASWRIMEKSGAKREMVMKDHILRDGESYDMYGYGFLRPEYEALKQQYSTRFPGATLQAMIDDLASAAEQPEGAEAAGR